MPGPGWLHESQESCWMWQQLNWPLQGRARLFELAGLVWRQVLAPGGVREQRHRDRRLQEQSLSVMRQLSGPHTGKMGDCSPP